nr:hypothetical protein CK203_067782 [Ipomoea batatas]
MFGCLNLLNNAISWANCLALSFDFASSENNVTSFIAHISPLSLLKPTYTCPNVPLPSNFPFFQREPGLVRFSAFPGLLATEGDAVAEFEWENGNEFDILTGGRGKG